MSVSMNFINEVDFRVHELRGLSIAQRNLILGILERIECPSAHDQDIQAVYTLADLIRDRIERLHDASDQRCKEESS